MLVGSIEKRMGHCGMLGLTLDRGVVSMWRTLILAAALLACVMPRGTFAQENRRTVTVEVYLPEDARLFVEGQEMNSTGPMRRFVSPPLSPGKYTYTIKTLNPCPIRPRTVTRRIDVRPG